MALMVAAFGAGWLAKSGAQPKPPAPFITYFSHEKVDASFTKALTSEGSRMLYAHKDSQGKTYSVHTNSRGKSGEGEIHQHQGWNGIVVIMSGSATFNTPGTAAPASQVKKAADPLGGQAIGGGESHRVGKGDVVVIPPNAPHFYTNIEEPFRYLVVETPL
jgi:hypothetical protein